MRIPGNVYLFGEYGTLYNNPCLVSSIDLYMHAHIEEVSSGIFIESSIGEGIFTKNGKKGCQDLFVLLDFVRFFCEQYNIISGLHIVITSEVPLAAGLSSSSTSIACVLSALSDYFHLAISSQDYYKLLLPYQAKIHGGIASGSEIISNAFGGFHLLSFSENVTLIDSKKIDSPPLHIVLGNTNKPNKSIGMITNYFEKLKNKPEVRKNFDLIAKLAVNGAEYLASKNLRELGKLMNKNHTLLMQMGFSDSLLDAGCTAALKAGAYGAKLTGKGQGGAMFAIVTKESMENVILAVEEAGLEALSAKIGVPSLQNY